MENESNKKEKPSNDTYVTQVRIPDKLALKAKAYAEDTGLSMNGLLCVALDEYLRIR